MKTLAILLSTVLTLGSWISARAADVDEIVVEALVGADSEFHVRASTVWWEVGPNAAKPGKWNALDEPTYINGSPWAPRWREKGEKGPDKSAPFSIALKTTEVEFVLLAITKQRGETGLDRRTPPTAKLEGGHFVVRIPDPEAGGRWYKFALRKKSK